MKLALKTEGTRMVGIYVRGTRLGQLVHYGDLAGWRLQAALLDFSGNGKTLADAEAVLDFLAAAVQAGRALPEPPLSAGPA